MRLRDSGRYAADGSPRAPRGMLPSPGLLSERSETVTLLPRSAAQILPPFCSQESVEDPLCRVRFFLPGTRWAWYAMEYQVESERFFGYVTSGQDPLFDELGYFSLRELETATREVELIVNNESMGLFPVFIERDQNFTPCPLSELKRQVKENEREGRGL